MKFLFEIPTALINKWVFPCCFLLTLSACSFKQGPETPPGSPEWSLVWSDEFNYEGLPDPEKWTYEVGNVRNQESQFYAKERLKNSRVENGRLIIEAHREDYRGERFSSASITTLDKAEWQYGRFEVRAKLPGGRGTWPAIWMIGSNIDEVGWFRCGEIDIMENVGFDPNRVHAYIHNEAYNHVKKTQRGSTIVLKEPDKNFYIYALEWGPEQMTFYADGVPYFTFHNEGGGEEVWPFDQPFYLLLNLAIGGVWGGIKGIDESAFPQRYEIDYVRIYQTTATKDRL